MSTGCRAPTEPDEWPWLAAAAVLSSFPGEELRPMGGGEPDLARTGAMLMRHGEPVTLGPERGRWQLGDDSRRLALCALAQRGELEAALAANPTRPTDAGQRALEEMIAKHGRVELAGRSLTDLLGIERASDWLADVPGLTLPDPVDLDARIERLKLLEPMRRLAGTGFAGRVAEMTRLRAYVDELPPHDWHERVLRWSGRWVDLFRYRPPLMVHGPGGVGKSTLLARFILDHADVDVERPLPFLYLDLDRGTLLPDNPDVLLEEAAQQIRVQFPELADRAAQLGGRAADRLAAQGTGRVSESAHLERSREVRADLSSLLNDLSTTRHRNLLMVVDTFEVAQRRGPTVAFKLLDFLGHQLSQVPALRVVIVGRAPLRASDFGFATVAPSWEPLPLEGFEPASAAAYVRGRLTQLGVLDAPDVAIRRAVELGGVGRGIWTHRDARSNPLSLRLAAQVFAREGLAGLDDALGERRLGRLVEDERIQGMLHSRIIRGLRDDLRQIADPGLIVRRLTAGVVAEVLAGPCGLTLDGPSEAATLLRQLRDEFVDLLEPVGEDALRHRADVRMVMLPLLRAKLGPQARTIDAAAVAYWAGHAGSVARAEEIYHRIWLGQRPDQLDACWPSDEALSLHDALDELDAMDGDVEIRIWLYQRLGRELPAVLQAQAGLYAWERDIVLKVRSLLDDGAAREALFLLRQRPDRSATSPLWALESDALRLLGHDADAVGTLDRALAVAPRGASEHRYALWLRRSALEERAERYPTALAAAETALAEAEASGRDDLQLAAGLACARIQRKLGNADDPEREALIARLRALLEKPQVQAALEQQPTLLREAAAELGMGTPSLLLQVLERVGLTEGELRQLGDELMPLLPVAAAAMLSQLLSRGGTTERSSPKLVRLGQQVAKLLGGVLIVPQARQAVINVLTSAIDRLLRQRL